jgi:hypothetical protein
VSCAVRPRAWFTLHRTRVRTRIRETFPSHAPSEGAHQAGARPRTVRRDGARAGAYLVRLRRRRDGACPRVRGRDGLLSTIQLAGIPVIDPPGHTVAERVRRPVSAGGGA